MSEISSYLVTRFEISKPYSRIPGICAAIGQSLGLVQQGLVCQQRLVRSVDFGLKLDVHASRD